MKIKHIANESSAFSTAIFVFPLTSSGVELLHVAGPEANLSFYEESAKMFCDHYNILLACLLPEGRKEVMPDIGDTADFL